MPFLDPAVIQPLSIPIVFASAPQLQSHSGRGRGLQLLRLISENRPVRFPVHIGQIPQGNAIVIPMAPAICPPGLNLPA
jgi:cellulose synthase (UDP-forming)